MNKIQLFFKLLTHQTWSRITGRIKDLEKWGILLHFVLYNAGYVSVMGCILYLIFKGHGEELASANPVPLALLCAQSIFSLSFVSLFVIGCEEALIRCIFSKNNPHLFDELFDMQKEMQNILMGLLSILAIIAAVYPGIAEQLNRILLFAGIILFACILVTTLYEQLFLKIHAIEDILKQIQ